MDRQERQARIKSYGTAYEQLVAALETFPKEMWQFRPAPGEWSIHEQIIHLADSEANSFVRLRRGVAEPGSAVLGYDQDIWAIKMDYHAQNYDDALQLFRWLRQLSYSLIRSLPEETWSHTIEHSENGTMTLDDWLVVYDDHTPGHIKQMQACCQAWQAQQK
jgi:hypothetical protein